MANRWGEAVGSITSDGDITAINLNHHHHEAPQAKICYIDRLRRDFEEFVMMICRSFGAA